MVFLLLRMDGEGRGRVYACEIKLLACLQLISVWKTAGKVAYVVDTEVFEGQCSKCTAKMFVLPATSREHSTGS